MSDAIRKAAGGLRLGLTFDDVLLVPQRTSVKRRADVRLASRFTPRIELGVPIVSANAPFCTGGRLATAMARLGGLGVVHRMCTPGDQAEAVKDTKTAPVSLSDFPLATVDRQGRLRVGAAVGVIGDYLERADLLVRAGVDVLVLDIAHGHADYALFALRELRGRHPDLEVVAGNVATAAGTRDLVEAGAAAIKVGIGPGSICTTRLVSGAGVPQLTAVMDCVVAAQGLPVIADGGIRSSGDIVKALAAGASTVMLGGMLAGVEESEARLVEVDGTKHKVSTGYVTLGVKLLLKHLAQEKVSAAELDDYVPEGVEATFPYAGEARQVIRQLAGGMQSGFSYCGASTIEELWARAEFMQVTAAALAESRPHALGRGPQIHPDYKKLFAR